MAHLPIRIGTLRPDAVVRFDIFIQVGTKLIHYLKKEEPFDQERIVNLRKKGVKKLFILETSETDYLNYLDEGLDAANQSQKPIEQRAELVHDSLRTDAENVVRNVQTQEGYQRTEKRIEKILHFLTSESSSVKAVLEHSGFSQDFFQHSATVVSLSLGLASKLGIKDNKELLELGLAALLHDVSLGKLGFTKHLSKSDLTGENRKKYEDHPKQAALELATKPYITKSILEMIADHEEIGEGNGYPEKKMISKLSVCSQILNLCNAFDNYAGEKKVSHKVAAKTFMTDQIGIFDLQHIKKLLEIV